MMDETKEFAEKFVNLTIAQADIQVFKHLNDYMKKYAQKLQRDANDLDRRLSKMEKKGVESEDYGSLKAKRYLLTFQIHKAKDLEAEFLKRAIELTDICDKPMDELQKLHKRLSDI